MGPKDREGDRISAAFEILPKKLPPIELIGTSRWAQKLLQGVGMGGSKLLVAQTLKQIMIVALALSTPFHRAQANTATTISSNLPYAAYLDQCSGEISDARCHRETLEKLRDSSMVNQGRQITLDTRDEAACLMTVRTLKRTNGSRLKPFHSSHSLNDVCKYDPQNPYVTITIFEGEKIRHLTPADIEWLTSTDHTLPNQTRNLAFIMVATMVALWAAPSTVSNWDKETLDEVRNNPFGEYVDNIKAGPVWDHDRAFFNYVAHPIAGAGYYLVARNLGYTPMQSFGYSALMSTFFWEYGFEALAEKPSIQDLIITPVVGSLLGEGVFHMIQSIQANNGQIWGSKRLGDAAMVVLNPLEASANLVNKVIGTKVIQSTRGQWVIERRKFNGFGAPIDTGNHIGFEFTWVYN